MSTNMQGADAPTPDPAERSAAHFLDEGAPVEQAGQRIGARLMRHFPLQRFMFQDHADDADGGTDQRRVFLVPGTRCRAAPDRQAGMHRRSGCGSRRPVTGARRGWSAWLGSMVAPAIKRSAAVQHGGRTGSAFVQHLDLGSVANRADNRRAFGAQGMDQRPQRCVHHAVAVSLLPDPRKDVIEHSSRRRRPASSQRLCVAVGHVDADAARADDLTRLHRGAALRRRPSSPACHRRVEAMRDAFAPRSSDGTG